MKYDRRAFDYGVVIPDRRKKKKKKEDLIKKYLPVKKSDKK